MSNEGGKQESVGRRMKIPFLLLVCLVIFSFSTARIGLSTAAVVQVSSITKDDSIHSMQHHEFVRPVDCTSVSPVEPIHLGKMSGNPPYTISFAWWDVRLQRPNYKSRRRPVASNPTVRKVRELLDNSTGVFVDIGANVGFMTNNALASGRTVYAVEPIAYNIAKLCEAHRAETTTTTSRFHLYHAAAGASIVKNVTIVRPSNKAGWFDRASLSRENVQLHGGVTEEHIPLLTVDSIVPPDVPVGVVKIDVQGHEWGVVQGMKQLFTRTTGFPKYVFYETDPKQMERVGYRAADVEELLKGYGYTCIPGHDTLCTKE